NRPNTKAASSAKAGPEKRRPVPSFVSLRACSCGRLLNDLLFVAVNPCIQVSFVETPAFIEANLSKLVANYFLFEAVPCKTAIFGGFVEVEDAFCRRAIPNRVLQLLGQSLCERWQVNEI